MNSDLVRPTNKLKDLLPQLSLEFCSNLPKREMAGPPAALSKCLPFTATILHTNTLTSYISRCHIPTLELMCNASSFRTITVKLVTVEDSFKLPVCLWPSDVYQVLITEGQKGR